MEEIDLTNSDDEDVIRMVNRTYVTNPKSVHNFRARKKMRGNVEPDPLYSEEADEHYNRHEITEEQLTEIPVYDFKTLDAERVEVRPSNVPSAGMGLFAKIDIAKNHYICSYDGVVIKTADAQLDEYKSEYVWEYDDYFSIDSRHEDSCKGRYANDIVGEWNADIYPYRVVVRGYLMATEDIKAGDEISISYGSGYWNVAKKLRNLDDETIRRMRTFYPELNETIDSLDDVIDLT